MELFYGAILLGFLTINILNTPPFNKLCKKINTPEKIEIWAKHCLKYESDQKLFGVSNYWQSWEEMYKSKTGDCEDFAGIISEILSRNGYENFIMVFGNDKRAHAVCIFKYNDSDEWSFFSNYLLCETNTQKIKNIPYYYNDGDLRPTWGYTCKTNEDDIIETFDYEEEK